MPDRVFSLIVPYYNDSKYLDFWRKILLESRLLDYAEVIFVDDCSRDDEYKLLVSKLEGLCYIQRNKSNLGPWLARMFGLERVETEYFMFADADDEIDADQIIDFIRANNLETACDVYDFGFSKLYLTGKLKFYKNEENLIVDASKINKYFEKYRRSISLIAKFYKTITVKPIFLSISESVKRFRIAEDLYATTFLLSKNLRWSFRTEIIYRHIKRDDSITINSNYSQNAIEITNDAIISLISRIVDSNIENKGIYQYLISTLWKKKSIHHHPSFSMAISKLVNLHKVLLFSPISWALFVKLIYIKVRAMLE